LRAVVVDRDIRDIRLPVGSVLMDRYRIGSLLGRGGFGITYVAWDRVLELKLAVKEYFPMGLAFRAPDGTVYCPPGDEEPFEEGMGRFLEEARTLARLQGIDGIVSVRDYFRANGTAYMVMTYVEGRTLREFLEERGGRIPLDEALELLGPVMEALDRVHALGCLHRDVSPENVMVSKDRRCTLIDFGAARVSLVTLSSSAVLKPGYAPPEQYGEGGHQGPWTDVYALGATLYRCVCGFPPPDLAARTRGEALRFPPGVPRRGRRAILKALELDPDRRYRGVRGLMEDLTYRGRWLALPVPMRTLGVAALLGLFLALGALTALGRRVIESGLRSINRSVPSLVFPQGDDQGEHPGDAREEIPEAPPAQRPGPETPPAEEPLAKARRLFQEGDLEGALKWSQEAIGSLRDPRGALLIAARSALGLGRLDLARERAEALMKLDPLYPGLSELMEALKHKEGDGR